MRASFNAMIEQLECRRMLANISGSVFIDVNNNHHRDAGEPKGGGQTIYLDANDNGAFDTGEQSTVAASDGTYTLLNVPNGVNHVRLYPAPGYKVSLPRDNDRIANVSDVDVAGVPFGVGGANSISGTAFQDLNKNGLRDGQDYGLYFQIVISDVDNDGFFSGGDSYTFTASKGRYVLGNLLPGHYNIRLAFTPNSDLVAPTGDGAWHVKLSGAQNATRNFAIAATTAVTGTVYDDHNASGTRQANDNAMAGITVWDDVDADGFMDPTEPFAITDANGLYTMFVAPGAARIREQVPKGYRPTTPPAGYVDVDLADGQTLTGQDFGNTRRSSIRGVVFMDRNGDGSQASDDFPLAGWRVFVDANSDGLFERGELGTLTDANGKFSFDGLLAGTYMVAAGNSSAYAPSTPSSGSYTITLASAAVITNLKFGRQPIG